MNFQPLPLLLIASTVFLETLPLSTVSLAAIAHPTTPPTEQPHPALQLAQSRPRSRPTTITFNPPRRGAPPATVGLGSRGDCIENSGDGLAVLVPTFTANSSNESMIGLTTAAHPSFFVYVPNYQTSAQTLSLQIMRSTETGEEIEIHAQTFALPPTAGVVQLQTDRSAAPLELGQQYHWYISMVCNSVDQSGNAVVDGWIERTVPSPELAQQSELAEPIDRAILYGQAGIWYDTLLTLAELRRTQPNDSTLAATWQALLQSVGLEAIANAPLIECCQPLN